MRSCVLTLVDLVFSVELPPSIQCSSLPDPLMGALYRKECSYLVGNQELASACVSPDRLDGRVKGERPPLIVFPASFLLPFLSSLTQLPLTFPLFSHMQMGIVALAAFTLLTLLSFKPFLRRMAYEAFLLSHILLALYVFPYIPRFHVLRESEGERSTSKTRDRPQSPCADAVFPSSPSDHQSFHRRRLHALASFRDVGLAFAVPLVGPTFSSLPRRRDPSGRSPSSSLLVL